MGQIYKIILCIVFFSYLANLCWDGGCINFIILRRVKQKAPSPPCDVSASVGVVEGQTHDRDASKCCDNSENHRRSRNFGCISEPSFAQDSNPDLNYCDGSKSFVLTDSGDHGGTATTPARAHSQMIKSHIDSFSRESPRQVRCSQTTIFEINNSQREIPLWTATILCTVMYLK